MPRNKKLSYPLDGESNLKARVDKMINKKWSGLVQEWEK